MTHFLVGVIMPKDTLDIEVKIAGLISEYDENKKMPEHDEVCSCIGWLARKEVRKTAAEKFGDIEVLRKSFKKDIQATTQIPDMSGLDDEERSKAQMEYCEKLDACWREYIKLDERNAYEKELEEKHPDIKSPDPECDECNGTGIVKSNYNPDSKWDWWRVGGRYDGCMADIEVENSDNGFNFGDQHQGLHNNIVTTEKLVERNESISFALVTPEGEWIERGKMGWWAMVSDAKDEDKWDKEYVEVLKKYPGHIVVGIDCHI